MSGRCCTNTYLAKSPFHKGVSNGSGRRLGVSTKSSLFHPQSQPLRVPSEGTPSLVTVNSGFSYGKVWVYPIQTLQPHFANFSHNYLELSLFLLIFAVDYRNIDEYDTTDSFNRGCFHA